MKNLVFILVLFLFASCQTFSKSQIVAEKSVQKGSLLIPPCVNELPEVNV